MREEAAQAGETEQIADDRTARFEAVAKVLRQLDIGAL